MALMLSKKKSAILGTILAADNLTNTIRGTYDGVNDIVLISNLANMTPQQMSPHIFTATEVLASTSSSPFFTYSSGNQNISAYYDNGDIVVNASNCPTVMVAYKGNFSLQ